MDLNFDDETLAFQAEVREFLAANAASIPTKSYDNAEGFAQHRYWDRVLFDAGLSVITWPAKYGGRDAPLLHWIVFEEDTWRSPFDSAQLVDMCHGKFSLVGSYVM